LSDIHTEAEQNVRRGLLKKQCSCRGTSSGPRMTKPSIERKVVIVDGEEYHQFIGKTAFADLVCDVCETPWKVTDEDQQNQC
jgi:hypothetical protein